MDGNLLPHGTLLRGWVVPVPLNPLRIGNLRLAALLPSAVVALVAGCASTTVTLSPSPQAPLCAHAAHALVLWAPRWRADQKDVPAREEAAAAGLRDFLAQPGCFAQADLRRVQNLEPATVGAHLANAKGAVSVVVGVEVHELGPVVKLLSSVALVEGGTEVLLRIVEFAPPSATVARQFTVHWQSGGVGVVKGVASLPGDMQAALLASFQPGAPAR